MKSKRTVQQVFSVAFVTGACVLGSVMPAAAVEPPRPGMLQPVMGALPAEETAPLGDASGGAPGLAEAPAPVETFDLADQDPAETGRDGEVSWQKFSDGTLVFGPGTFEKNIFNADRAWKSNIPVTRIVFTEPATTFLPANSAWFFAESELTEIVGSGQINTAHITNMTSMFSGASGLTGLDLSGWNTEGVDFMASMFAGASGLTRLDLSGWNTEGVENMTNMFSGVSGLAVLGLGPETRILNTAALGNPSGLLWYHTSSSDPATLTVIERIGAGLELAQASTGQEWQGGTFMTAAPILLDENRPEAVGGTSQVLESESVTIQPLIMTDDVFSLKGYALNGWNSKADGTGTTYQTGDFWSGTGSPVLFAQWEMIVPPVEDETETAPESPSDSAGPERKPVEPVTSLPHGELAHTGADSMLAVPLAALLALSGGCLLFSRMRKRTL